MSLAQRFIAWADRVILKPMLDELRQDPDVTAREYDEVRRLYRERMEQFRADQRAQQEGTK